MTYRCENCYVLGKIRANNPDRACVRTTGDYFMSVVFIDREEDGFSYIYCNCNGKMVTNGKVQTNALKNMADAILDVLGAIGINPDGLAFANYERNYIKMEEYEVSISS